MSNPIYDEIDQLRAALIACREDKTRFVDRHNMEMRHANAAAEAYVKEQSEITAKLQAELIDAYDERDRLRNRLKIDPGGSDGIDALTLAMEMLRVELAAEKARGDLLQGIVSEVHAWIVCYAITSADDLMQSAERIERITRPEG